MFVLLSKGLLVGNNGCDLTEFSRPHSPALADNLQVCHI
jgi:hypothetical protein